MNIFEVGGCVRDEILGRKSKDIDFTVVLSGNEDAWHTMGGNDPFVVMVRELEGRGFKIHTTTEKFLVAKAKFPKTGEFAKYSGLDADFVLARKEEGYTDGRRPDKVEVGTLTDDLNRRDFTMNAVAKSLNGEYIDLHNGIEDIEHRLIRCVGNPIDRLREDALRAVRALRFSVVLGFRIDPELAAIMDSYETADAIVSLEDDRIRVEMSKMFRHNTLRSLDMLSTFTHLTDALFAGRVSLDASMKDRK